MHVSNALRLLDEYMYGKQVLMRFECQLFGSAKW